MAGPMAATSTTRSSTRRSALAAALVLLQALASNALAQAPADTARAGPPRRTAPASKPAAGFTEAASRAAAARDSGATEEAIRWYRRATAARPGWDEGWWYIGALSYELKRPVEAATAFGRFVSLKPESGPGWALRGLSEFDAKRYDAAMRHLARGLSLGTVGNAEIRDAVYYTMAVLRMRASQFELATEPLSALARVKEPTPALLGACGVFVLRLPMLPADVPAEKRDLLDAAGRAAFAALGLKPDAAKLFDEALARFPTVPNLHYAYGAYLLSQGEQHADAALTQLRLEIEGNPGSVYAPLELAFELLKRGQHQDALGYAQSAVRLAPQLFAGHHALGRALLETGDVPGAVRELEEAVRLAPESPEMRAALARAYVMAGRRQDAERERAVYQKLQVEREKKRLPGFAREDTITPGPAPRR
jgi:tetratricopeptide (TPR) repeat protein